MTGRSLRAPDFPQHLVPVPSGQEDIEQHQVDHIGADEEQTVLAALRREHLVAMGGQSTLDHTRDGRLVLDQQNSHTVEHTGASAPGPR